MSAGIILLVGNIASGKSTWASAAARDGAIVVNEDAIVSAVHGGRNDLYHKDLKPVYKAAEHTIARMALALGRDVVIDRTNLSVASRRQWIALATSLDRKIAAHVMVFESPAVHARRRFAADARGYSLAEWLKVANRKADEYETPHMWEGLDNVQFEVGFDPYPGPFIQGEPRG